MKIWGQATLDRHKDVIVIAGNGYRGCSYYGCVVRWLLTILARSDGDSNKIDGHANKHLL